MPQQRPDPLKAVYEGLSAQNPALKKAGFDAFYKDMQNEDNLRAVYNGLSVNNPQLKETGFDGFKTDMYGAPVEPVAAEPQTDPVKKKDSPSSAGSSTLSQGAKDLAAQIEAGVAARAQEGEVEDKRLPRTVGTLESLNRGIAATLTDIIPQTFAQARAAGTRTTAYTDKDLNDQNSLSEAANYLVRKNVSEGNFMKALGVGDEEAREYIKSQIGKPQEFVEQQITEKNRLLEEARKQQAEFQEYTKGIPKQISEISSPSDVGKYVAYTVGQTIPQIGLSLASGGMSSYVQEFGEIYDQQLQKIAEDQGISVDEVVRKGLDDPAAGQTAALFAAALDRVGVEAIFKNFGKEALKNIARSGSKSQIAKAVGVQALKTGGTEGITEGAQTAVEQSGSSLAAGRGLGRSVSDINMRDVLESAAAGATSGIFLSGAGSATQVATNAIQNANSEQSTDVPASAAGAPMGTPESQPEAQVAPRSQGTEGAAAATAPQYEVKPVVGSWKGENIDYTPSKTLNTDESVVEAKVGQDLDSNYQQRKEEYESQFGNVLDADNARQMSEDYQANPEGLSDAVQRPTSAFLLRVYKDKLQEPAPEGKKNMVSFTAGGPGVGKSTFLSKNPNDAQIIYDTNMANPQISKNQINRALNAGKDVEVNYVFRDPLEAFEEGVIPRAERTGRTIPISQYADIHLESQKTVQQLLGDYAGNDRVKINLIDNTGTQSQPVASVEELKMVPYTREELINNLSTINDKMLADGKITPAQHAQFKGTIPTSDEGQAQAQLTVPEPAGPPSSSEGISPDVSGAPQAPGNNQDVAPVAPVAEGAITDNISVPSSARQQAIDQVKARAADVKKRWDDLYNNQNLAAIYDPQKRAKDLYDFHKELVLLAKDVLNAGITTAEEFAGIIGRNADTFLRRAFNDAQRELTGESPEVTSEDYFKVSGIKKALVDPQQAAEFEQEIEKRSTKEMLERGKRAVESGDINPEAIVDEIVDKGARALQPLEVAALVYYKTKLDNQYDAVNKQLLDAMQSGQETELDLRGQFNYLQEKIDRYNEMAVKTAYEQSLAFRLRQMLLDSEYNLQTQINKYKAINQGVIPQEIEDKFRDLDNKLKEANQKIADFEKRRQEEEEAAIIKRMQDVVSREKKVNPKGPRRGKELMAEGFDDLAQALGITQMAIGHKTPSIVAALEKIGKGMIDEGLATLENVSDKIRDYVDERFAGKVNYDDFKEAVEQNLRDTVKMPEVNAKGKVVIPGDYLKNLVASGVDDINVLVDKVYEVMVGKYPDVSKRQIRDAITNYGRTITMSKDEIDAKLREMKRVGKLISGLEDVQGGQAPKRSGLQRDKPTDKERKMQRELRDAMKDLPQEEGAQEKAWATALATVKNRLKNTISDLQEQIATGQKSAAKKGVEYDAEAIALREKVNELRSIVQEMEGPRQMSDEQRVKLAIASAERSIAEYERRLNTGDTSGRNTKKAPETPELIKVRAKRDALRQAYEQMLEQSGATEKKRLQNYKNTVKRTIADLEDRIKNKNFEKEVKRELKLDKEAEDLITERERIKHEFDVEQERVKMKNRSTSEKVKDYLLEAWSLPKSLLSSVDLSAPLRQGAILSAGNPGAAGKAFVEMFRMFASDRRYNDWFQRIKSDPNYPLFRNSKLYLSEPSAKLTAREENFMSSLANKIPLVKASGRAYTAYLNVLRTEVFANGADRLREQGITWDTNPEAYKQWADFVNNATGRGNLGGLEAAAPILNSVFFSPRYLASRFNVLNPVKYAKMDPATRRMALRNIITYIGFGNLVLGLAAAAGADVEDDPRSTDFGKIRIGATRYDIWAGLQPVVRFLSQIISGQKKNTVTGKIQSLTSNEFGAPSRLDVVGRFARGKLSPSAGTTVNLLQGKDFMGNEVTIEGELIRNAVPLYIQDMASIYNEEGATGLAKTAIPAVFGIGVQNYKKPVRSDEWLPEEEPVAEEELPVEESVQTEDW